MLQTPVIAIKKGKKIIRWTYNLKDELNLKSTEDSSYKKGLGSWKEVDLKHVVEKDGIEKMIDILEWDDEEVIDDWLGDNSEPRKKYILNNHFNIAQL